jgi:hypothetical protein
VDLQSALMDVFPEMSIDPDVGSIWAAPNNIWNNEFAWNQRHQGYHPAIVAEKKSCNVLITILPGTTSKHDVGVCVYRVMLKPGMKTSYFLFNLAMPYVKDDLLKLERGWSGVDELTSTQLIDFQKKIEYCL